MDKNFDIWNNLKKTVDKSKNDILFKEGDIWWTSLGLNIGTESCGKGIDFRRPVLVIKKLSRYNCIIIPLSTKIKSGTWFISYSLHGVKYTALLYQIKMIDVKRFTKREAHLSYLEFDKIKKKLKLLLSL